MQTHQTGRRGRTTLLTLLALFASALISTPAVAGETRGGWGNWWLPPDHSTHGGGIDTLFNWIFWITMIIFVAVELVLVVFLIFFREPRAAPTGQVDEKEGFAEEAPV